ncbi:MAG: helix-turn-helix transcriptional regulator [Gammaproteobacteria bacterium]|nr:helix-turn-helix transcriptional regulator [Gammaproteobacteria bacterium]
MTLNGKSTIHPGTAFFKRDQEFLNLLKQTFDQNYSKRDFNLRTMSEKMDISSRQIQRKFKELLGSTPSEYLRSYRLKKSLLLLREGLTVGEVSSAVGFSSQSYFASCFKAQFGQTASEYQISQSQKASNAS